MSTSAPARSTPRRSPGRDDAWTGRQLAGAVVYELHVGTFTPEGTLDAALGRLDHLTEIGVDLVELMPVNAFNGTHNWGYDGVGWFAVDETYGGPAAYQRFVDGCHAAGLGVVQDVVYNHFGPSGNYLPLFGPYLKEGASSWGDLVNLDGEQSREVRRYILDNALMWLRDFHVDGLRLDAVHALVDSSETHLLEELAIEVAALSAYVGRPLTLIAESDLNDPVLVTPREAGGYGLDAQWSDDFHHAVHVALTRETEGYYADFEPLSALAKVCERGFFHDGTFSSFRERDHGVPIDTSAMPTWRLVVCHQNHDQVGNRARGDRTTEVLDVDQLASAALLTLAGPFTPMLFQGEEWAASTPFQFFTSHPEPELGQATAAGRILEFEKMGWDPDVGPRPTGSRDVHPLEAGLVGEHGRSARAAARGVPPPGRAPPHRTCAHGPVVQLRLLHGRRGEPGLHDAPWRPARRRELRGCCRRPGGRRGHSALRHAERPVRRDRNAAPPAAHGSSPGAGALVGPDVIRPGRPGDRFV